MAWEGRGVLWEGRGVGLGLCVLGLYMVTTRARTRATFGVRTCAV